MYAFISKTIFDFRSVFVLCLCTQREYMTDEINKKKKKKC